MRGKGPDWREDRRGDWSWRDDNWRGEWDGQWDGQWDERDERDDRADRADGAAEGRITVTSQSHQS